MNNGWKMEIVFSSHMGYLEWRDEIIKTATGGNKEIIDLLVKIGVNPKIIKENCSDKLRYILNGFLKLRYVDEYVEEGDSARVELYIELQERDEDDEEDLYEEDNQELIVFIKAYGGI